VTLQLLTPVPDAPPSKATSVMQAVPRAEVKREDECLPRNAQLDQISGDLKRAILKYALCDQGAMIRPHQETAGSFSHLFAPSSR
jgi:hypothetical protein